MTKLLTLNVLCHENIICAVTEVVIECEANENEYRSNRRIKSATTVTIWVTDKATRRMRNRSEDTYCFTAWYCKAWSSAVPPPQIPGLL